MLTCPCASRCGGCDKISVPYEETLREKQAYISSLLSRFGDPLPILSMQNPYYYRNKVHRVFARDRSGRVLCGNYKAGTHQVVEVDACLIEDKASQRVIRTVRDLAASFRIPVYDEDRETGLLRHVLVRRGFATGELLVVQVMTSPVFPGKNNFVRALLQAHPEITSLVLNINARHTTMVLGEKNVTLHGPGYIRDTLCGLTFRISPTSFYQINPVQTEKLYATAVSFAGLSGRETVLDAYCGIGTIGLSAASRAGHVTGVELPGKTGSPTLNSCRGMTGSFWCAVFPPAKGRMS